MKKIIASALLLVTSSLPFAAFAYQDCPIPTNDDGNNAFCQCFYNNCSAVLNSGGCTYPRLANYLHLMEQSGGLAAVCSKYAKNTSLAQCQQRINKFLSVCG